MDQGEGNEIFGQDADSTNAVELDDLFLFVKYLRKIIPVR